MHLLPKEKKSRKSGIHHLPVVSSASTPPKNQEKLRHKISFHVSMHGESLQTVPSKTETRKKDLSRRVCGDRYWESGWAQDQKNSGELVAFRIEHSSGIQVEAEQSRKRERSERD